MAGAVCGSQRFAPASLYTSYTSPSDGSIRLSPIEAASPYTQGRTSPGS